MPVTLDQLVSNDAVNGPLLVVGDPACGFLIGYAAMIWWLAEYQQERLRTWLYVLAASGGLAIVLFWPPVAAWLLDIMARTSPDGLPAWSMTPYVQSAVLWPAGWCLLSGAALVALQGRQDHTARSILAGLGAGFFAVLPPLAALVGFGFLVPDLLRVLSFLMFLAVAMVMLIIAGWRSRVGAPTW